MALSEEKVLEVLNEIAAKAKLEVQAKAVYYKEETWDYFVVIGTVQYTEIREKLIKDYLETKNPDTFREIAFKLRHSMELEDWQKEELGLLNPEGGGDDKSAIDDSSKNDWV